jgi:hypothetical protein
VLALKEMDDYDVIGADGLVIGCIFKATTSPVRTPWMWTLAYGDQEDRTPALTVMTRLVAYRSQRSVGPTMSPAISCSTGVHSWCSPGDG